MVKRITAAVLIAMMPLILLAASTQIDWTQIKNKPSFWNDPGSGTILKRTGAFTFAAALAADLNAVIGYTPENAANKGAASGYAPLDGSSKVPAANLPSAWNDPGSGTLLKRTGAFTFGVASNTDVNSVIGFTPENSANRNAASGYAPLDSSTLVPIANLRNCAEGGSHTAGQVPDPGASTGTTKFLREDCSFAIPATGFDPTQYFFQEDFESVYTQNVASFNIGKYGWSPNFNLGNGCTTTTVTTGTIAHPGIITIGSAGTAAGDGCSVRPQNTTDIFGALGGTTTTNWTMYAVFQLGTTANIDIRVGFIDSSVAASLAPSNGMFVRYLSSSDTNFTFENRSGGSATTSTTNSQAVDTNWHCIKLASTGVSGSISYQIGSTCGSLNSATTVTGAPTGTNMTPAFIIASDSVAGVRTILMDLYFFNGISIGR